MKKSSLFLMGLFMSFLTYAQSWDYVNYEDGSYLSAMNATIDQSDNVYTYGSNVGFTRAIRRFDNAGNLQWTKDISSLLSYTGNTGEGGIEYKGANIYAVGSNGTNKGAIVSTGVSGAAIPSTWDQLTGSNSRILDIRIKGNFLYVVGHFGSHNTPSSTISFFDGTTLTGNRSSTYIAKYTITPTKTLVWAKKIDASNITRGTNIDVDNDGNVYITGDFRGTAIFYNGVTPHIFTSSTPSSTATPDTFLAKFDANGNFNTTFGLKTDGLTNMYNWRSYDVEVSDTNNAIYWAEDTKVVAYDKNGAGSFLWSRNIAPKPYSIETNNCGDVYVTGATYDPVNKSSNSSKAPCGYTYFATSLNNTNGVSIWGSNSTSCSSFGSEALIDSNNKEILVGSYFTSGVSTPLTIDGSYASGGARGYFIGRYDDAAVNNCCKENIVINIPTKIKICDSNFEEICAPVAPVGNSYSYQWWGPHPTLNMSILLSTSMCFTPTQYGTYKLDIVDQNGCITTFKFSILEAVGPTISIDDIYYCGKAPRMVGFNYSPIKPTMYRYSFEWTYNGNPIGSSGDYQIPNQGDGEYCVTINWPSNTGWCSSTTCFIVQQCCKPDPSFNTYFSASPTANNLVISNIPSYAANYEEETYNVYRQCTGETSWTQIHTVTRTGADMYTPISLTVDHTCKYRILHIINQTCMQKCFVSNVYLNETRKITVAPNPVKDHFKINIEDFKTVKEASVKILDASGILFYESSITSNDFKVNTTSWKTGLYFCKLQIDDKEYMKRIIKK
ncbi:MAG: hypothetical protein COA88_06350 [Kordia sp.]|nr:MAG: hypothetical protein COA88_06350 [Kordia sp.]